MSTPDRTELNNDGWSLGGSKKKYHQLVRRQKDSPVTYDNAPPSVRDATDNRIASIHARGRYPPVVWVTAPTDGARGEW